MSKPIIIFTTFWDADFLIGNKFLLIDNADKEKAYKIDVSDGKILSIALSHPDIKKLKHIKAIPRIDCFCPTWNILKRYKNDKDWEKYKIDYINLIKERKDRIKDFIGELEEKVYFFCCWEDTSLGSKCHRQILYDKFNKSKYMKEKAFLIYRDGKKQYKLNIAENYDTDVPVTGWGEPYIGRPTEIAARAFYPQAENMGTQAANIYSNIAIPGPVPNVVPFFEEISLDRLENPPRSLPRENNLEQDPEDNDLDL